MDPFTLSLGVQLAGAGLSWWQRRQMADAQRAAARESERRFRAEGERRLGTARVGAAASGFDPTSASLTDYLAQMETEFERQAQWVRRSGQMQANATDTAATFGLISDIGSSVFQYGRNTNWGRTG